MSVTDSRMRAFEVRILDKSRRGYHRVWKYCTDGREGKVPERGQEFVLEGRRYVVESRKMPLITDWRK